MSSICKYFSTLIQHIFLRMLTIAFYFYDCLVFAKLRKADLKTISQNYVLKIFFEETY